MSRTSTRPAPASRRKVAAFSQASASNTGNIGRMALPASRIASGPSAGEGAPASGVIDNRLAPPSLSERDQMLAARMDRLKQDQGLLALLLGQDGSSGGGFGGAFSPAGKESA